MSTTAAHRHTNVCLWCKHQPGQRSWGEDRLPVWKQWFTLSQSSAADLADFIQQTSATKKLTFEMRASTRNISGADEVLCSSSVLLLFENSQMGSFNFLFVTQIKGWITGVKIQSTSTVLWNSNCSSLIVPQWGAAAHTHKVTTWKNTCCGNHGDLGWSFLGSRLWGASRCLGPGSPPYLLLTSGAGLPTPTITHLGGETFWIVPCSRTPVCT